MNANALIKLIPADTFRDLAVETDVDVQVKKLSGEVMFKLILFSMLNSEKLSLRVMETYLQSAIFKVFSGFDIIDGKYNSIRDRICAINSDYFERLFSSIFSIYNKELKEESALSKVDSTYISLATKLFSGGMDNRTPDKRYLKYCVGLKGCIPCSVKVFTDQSHLSDEPALAELINDSNRLEGNVVVFDRGLQSRNTFDKFTVNQKRFITRSRLGLNIRCKVVKDNTIPEKPLGSTVTIDSDQMAFLYNDTRKKSQYTYRIIKGRIDKTREPICFVSNIKEEDGYTIAGWYRQRWEIEVFFKFIKQHLNVKHLVSRDSNGIKVMIYMTMILAILLIAYKKLNGLKGFKIAKLKFELELENEITKTIVRICGGDPAKAPHLFTSG